MSFQKKKANFTWHSNCPKQTNNIQERKPATFSERYRNQVWPVRALGPIYKQKFMSRNLRTLTNC